MAYARFIQSIVATVAIVAALAGAPALAQAPRMPPVFDQLASPFTESEVGGIGCAVASLGAGAGMVGLMGGPAVLRAGMGGTFSPRSVLEGSAAVAFVFSSACYVGQALAPVVLLGWMTLFDSFSAHRAGPSATPALSGDLSWLQNANQQGSAVAAPLP